MGTAFDVIGGTDSPSGRYAMAWGIPGVMIPAKLKDLVETQRIFEQTSFTVRNFVVDSKSDSIVGTIPLHTKSCRWYDGKLQEYKNGGNHFATRGHSSVAAFWSRNEDWVVVWHDGKWWYNAVYLGHRGPNGFHFIEIGDAIETAARREIKQRDPRTYHRVHQADGRDPYVELDDVNVLPPMLNLKLEVGVPKVQTLAFSGQAQMRIAVDQRGEIHARLIRMHFGPQSRSCR